MLVCHSQQWIYIGPPKTASSTCHGWLRQPALWDPSRDEQRKKHAKRIPPGCESYFVCVSRRERVDRARALWVHHCQVRRGQGLTPWTLAKYWAWPKAGIYRDQSIWHPPRVDYWIRFESLEHDLLNLPFVRWTRGVVTSIPHYKNRKRGGYYVGLYQDSASSRPPPLAF